MVRSQTEVTIDSYITWMIEVGLTLPLTQQSDTILGFKAPIDEETQSLLSSLRTFEKDIFSETGNA